MLPLTAPDTWKQLETPYGISEEIPALIEELGESFSTEILNEICWDYIYHQNTLDEVTFATIPYLISICEKSSDENFKMETFINVGVILSEMDAGDKYLFQIFADSTIERGIIDVIIESYKNAFARLKVIGQNLFDMVPEMDEGDKRHFLAAWATANERYDVAKVFSTYSDNDEYMCTCPDCESEFYVWNKDNKLILYTADPVFNKDQSGYSIAPRSLTEVSSIENRSPINHFEWLLYYINRLGIESLRPIIGYLFGEAKCPECQGEFVVFDGVRDPLSY
jgi:hypothetical protein